MDYSDRPVIITGIPRSGTSMVAGVTHLCGAWKGITVQGGKANPKGFFENHDLRENVIKPILKDMGMDPRGQYPLPETNTIKIPFDLKDRVIEKIKKQGWTSDQPWMWKGAKISLLWPIWAHAFPNAKWILVRRRSADIVYSCMHTGFMSAFGFLENQARVNVMTEREGWLWWIHQHEAKFVEMINSGLNIKTIFPERMVEGDYQQMKETIEWAGLDWNSKGVFDFIEPKFWKERQRRK